MRLTDDEQSSRPSPDGDPPTPAGSPGVPPVAGEAPFVGPGGEALPDSTRWRSLLADRKRLLILAVLPLLVVGALLLVTAALGDGALLDAAERADGRWLLLCAAGELLAYAGYVTVFRVAAGSGGGPRLSFRSSLHVVFAGLGATRLLAAGGAGGLAVFYWALRRAGAETRDAIVRVLGLNVFLFVIFGAAGWLAALVVLASDSSEVPYIIVIPWLVIAPLLLGVLIGVSHRSGQRGERRAPMLSERWPRHLREGLAGIAPGIGLSLRLVTQGRCARWSLPGAFLYWFGDILCLYAALRAFGVELPIEAVVLGYATGYLTALLPLPTGAEGANEAATLFALVALGAPLAPTLLGVLVFRLFSFWMPTIPAILTLPTLSRLGRRLAREAGVDQAPAPGRAPADAAAR